MRTYGWIFLGIITGFFAYRPGQAQGLEPVMWRFEAGDVRGNATTLYLSATLAPGWHLYSQFLKDGGPVPTRFYFEPTDDYTAVGVVREKGRPDKFYDDIYEMEITWYSKGVRFEQDLMLSGPSTTIQGRVEFMVCNEEMCIPSERVFEVKVGE